MIATIRLYWYHLLFLEFLMVSKGFLRFSKSFTLLHRPLVTYVVAGKFKSFVVVNDNKLS